MVIKRCRVCGRNFFKEPLLRYKNMPAGAQYLPEKKSLASDKGVDLKVWQCSGCGLVQLSNNPVPYYREVIRASAVSREMRDFRMRQFKNFVKKHSLKGKKIIEIGCGRGEYLSIMEKTGVKAYGLEYLEESVTKCVKNGLKVSKGFIENSTKRLNHRPFAGFFILNFLEHLPDPNSVLNGIDNNLSEGAVGIVEVPNFEMILKKNLFSEFTRDHLFYFTKETLETTLKLNGFEMINCEVIWHDYIISALVKKSPSTKFTPSKVEGLRVKKINLSHFYKNQEKIKREINKYLDRFGQKKVAIWGAGHQALAMISMMEMANKVRYVVDSAPFKQGKYTPATHLPIIPPETLNSEPVEAVIVMAAGYSDEVARIIQKKYGKKINIAILRDFGLEIV